MAFSVKVSGLNVYYGNTQVLFNVGLSCEPGQLYALIGPQGSGKSTLLRVLNRMTDMDGAVWAGKVSVGETPVQEYDPIELRTNVGMVLSEPVMFPGSVYDNIVGGLRLHGLKDKAMLQQRSEQALKSLGIFDEMQPILGTPADKLALPQRQMVCIARALAMQPQMLLMDEPTRVLDAASSMRLEEAMTSIKKKCTIIMATHILQQAGRVADQTALMVRGEVVEAGVTGDLFAHPKDKRTENYLTGRYV